MYLKYAECTIHVCSYMPSPAYDSGYALDQTFSTLSEVTFSKTVDSFGRTSQTDHFSNH